MAQILPYIAIYPGDWLQSELEAQPLEIQGLWLRMMFVMSRAENYGELSINGEPMSDEFIAKKCRISSKKFKKNAEILQKIGILKRNDDGVIYSGRMIKKRVELEKNRARQKEFYDKNHGKTDEEKPVENAEPNGDLTGHARARHISVSSQEEKKEEREESREAANAATHPELITAIEVEPQTKPTDPRRAHPAIVAVHEIVGIYPPKEIWDEIIDRLGFEIDVGRLKKCFTQWRARGYNKVNYSGFIDWYHEGIPEVRKNHGTNSKPTSEREKSAQRSSNGRAFADELERIGLAKRAEAAGRGLLGDGTADGAQIDQPGELTDAH